MPPAENSVIRLASLADLPALMALERGCDTAAHWSEQQYRDAIEAGANQRLVLVLDDPEVMGTIQGFLVARQIAPEWELENIVVAPQLRRTGIGKRLLHGLLSRARGTDSSRVFLEVRESNFAARGLYEQAGFRSTARRKSYYINPLEDAVLYACELDLAHSHSETCTTFGH